MTEKHFHRVLLTSVGCILICMCCLVSTTWAWFTVSVSNEDNTIQMGEFLMEYEMKNISMDSVGKGNETIWQVSIDNKKGNVQGYCRITVLYGESQSTVYDTEQIAPGENISFYIIAPEIMDIQIERMWGTLDESTGETNRLGNEYSVSGGDIISSVSAGDYVTKALTTADSELISGGDVIKVEIQNTETAQTDTDTDDSVSDGDIVDTVSDSDAI